MEPLLGKNIDELQIIAQSVGLPKYAGKQLGQWLYVHRVTSVDEMTDISLQGRERLKARYWIGRHEPMQVAVSIDGTKKYLFQIKTGETSTGYIESVFIPEEERATLCVSTQIGCKMGCKFCMTGTLGFHGQLPASEILNQIFTINSLEGDSISNVVYMGEGEPMDNIDEVLRSLHVLTSSYGCAWSPKRITVSSAGLIPGLKRYLEESECHLAISLHNPFAAERQNIMPVEKLYPIHQVINLIKQYDFSHQRRISFEYICWGGINDNLKYANALCRILKGIECRINLIRFHAGVSHEFPASNEKEMERFRDYLSAHGLITTIRKSRGEDILAACGMLAAKQEQ